MIVEFLFFLIISLFSGAFIGSGSLDDLVEGVCEIALSIRYFISDLELSVTLQVFFSD